MYNFLSDFFTKLLIKNNSIKNEDFEIYQFGFEKLISQICTCFFLIVSAIVFNAVLEAIVFYYVFKYMRKYAGGYHANTYIKCNSLYIITFVFILIISKNLNLNSSGFSVVLSIVSFVNILILSPIENRNNPIKNGFYYKYYKYSVLIALSLAILVLILSIFNFVIHIVISCTMITTTIYMYVEIIRRKESVMFNLKKKLCDYLAKKTAKIAINSTNEVSLHGMYQPKTPEKLIEFSEKKRG